MTQRDRRGDLEPFSCAAMRLKDRLLAEKSLSARLLRQHQHEKHSGTVEHCGICVRQRGAKPHFVQQLSIPVSPVAKKRRHRAAGESHIGAQAVNGCQEAPLASPIASPLRLEQTFPTRSKHTTRRETAREAPAQTTRHGATLSNGNSQLNGYANVFPRTSIPCPNGATLSELYQSRRDDLWGALSKEQLKEDTMRAQQRLQIDRARKQQYAKELEHQMTIIQQRKSEEHGYLMSNGFADDQSVFLQKGYTDTARENAKKHRARTYIEQIQADEIVRNQRRAREQAEVEAIERMQTLQAKMNYEAEIGERELKRKQNAELMIRAREIIQANESKSNKTRHKPGGKHHQPTSPLLSPLSTGSSNTCSSAWFQRRDVPAIAVWTEQLKLKQQEQEMFSEEAMIAEQAMLDRDRKEVEKQKRIESEMRAKEQAYQRDLEKLIEVRRRAQLHALTHTMSDAEMRLNHPLLQKAGVM